MKQDRIRRLSWLLGLAVTLGALPFGVGDSHAWVTTATKVPLNSEVHHSIERDAKGEVLIGYIDKGSTGSFGEEVWLKYHNGSTNTSIKIFETSDFLTTNPSLLKIPVFTSVSVAVHHTVGVDSTTTICVAAALGRTRAADDVSRVMFVYEELTLSVAGVLTQGTPRVITSDEGVGGNDNSNALRWFNTSSCHPQPVPANDEYYADGTHNNSFTDFSGIIRAAYSGSTPWFACSVGGYVVHSSANDPGYRYEEHQALYLFKELNSGTDWELHSNGSDDFEFEACEIANADDPSISATKGVHLAADHEASVDSAWALGYRERVFDGSGDTYWAVGGYTGTTTRQQFSIRRAPFAAVWDADGNGVSEPYVIYDAWEDDWGPGTVPSCHEDYIKVEPLDSTALDQYGNPFAIGSLGRYCLANRMYRTLIGSNFSTTINYVGMSADGDDLHIITGQPLDRMPAVRYEINGPKLSNFSVGDVEDRPVEYCGDRLFGDRAAILTDDTCAFLIEEGIE